MSNLHDSPALICYFPGMHRIRLFEPINVEGLRMEANIDYATESQAVGAIAWALDGNVECEPIKIHRRNKEVPDSIIILRSGAAGDILFLTPVLEALRSKFPLCHICLATRSPFQWIVADLNLVNTFSDFPVKMGLLGRYDWVIDLENTVEFTHDKHVVDIFYERAGIEPLHKSTLYFPRLRASDFEAECPKIKKRVGIQLSASSPVRTYPRVMELQNKLRAEGWEVAIFAEPGMLRFQAPIPDLINVCELGWSWPKSTDFLQTCDVVIGPDSSLIHFAGAMKIPAIGLYGSFDAKYRTAYQPSIHVIQAKGECGMAPCFHHGRRLIAFPSGAPCNQARVCTTLASISPDMIIGEMKMLGF